MPPTTQQPARAAVYTRVSSAEQVEGFSLDAQDAQCKALIAARGWLHAADYADEGISGRSTARPGFQALLSAARAGEFEIIVVHKLDRLSRSLVDMMLSLRELDQIGVKLVSVAEQFDFTTPIGKVTLAVIAALSEWYVDNLRAETQKGKRARAEAGHWSNRLPFGYDAEGGWRRDGGAGLAIPNEDAEGVRLAFRLALGGRHSYRQIGDELTRAGYRPTGRGGQEVSHFSVNSIVTMIGNPFYSGRVRYRGETFPGLHEPLVTEDMQRRAIETMQARRLNPSAKRTRAARPYLLSGLVSCALCGRPMRGEFRAYKEAGTRYYRCNAWFAGLSCAARFVRADELERVVAERLGAYAISPERQAAIHARAAELRAQAVTKAPDAAKERRRLEGMLSRLRDTYELGDIERDAYLARRDLLRAELDRIPAPVGRRAVKAAERRLDTLADVWRIANDEERARIVREMIERVTAGAGVVEIVWREPYRALLG